MEVVISNTTEVGITLIKDDVQASPPESFPGKLLSFLYRRYKVFNGDGSKGMVIIPTELIIDNGSKLKNIILELAKQNGLESFFIDWLVRNNYFCNSLVDRIVPGKLPDSEQKRIEKELGYEDNLMIMSEVYRLWAIETGEQKVHDTLSFSKSDEGIVITKDINTFRELKLRLLNGSHTFSCALAHLSGFTTVKEAMDNRFFANFIRDLMLLEIAPSIVNEQISIEMAKDFSTKVMDRYRNPHIEHQWLSISVQYSSKMRLRNIPVIKKYYEKLGTAPVFMVLGFAAFLLFMKAEENTNGEFTGRVNNKNYPVNDDNALLFAEKWQRLDTGAFVNEVMRDEKLWDADLSRLPGFTEAVTNMIHALQQDGALATLKRIISTELAEQPSN